MKSNNFGLFGFKIVDKNAHLINPILDYAIQHRRPVEVGLYFNDPPTLELLKSRLHAANFPLNAHSNHGRYHVFNLHETQSLLKEHIHLAQILGSTYSVIHTSYLPMNLHPFLRPALLSFLLDNLERAEQLCVAQDYNLYLENVYNPLSFYRDLFAGIHTRGLSRIHFCFDIGHAKVWSGATLDDWLTFMDELAALGFRLHCHLHANYGFTDEHLSMMEVEKMGIGAADGYYNSYGYPGAFWKIEQRFPAAVKVFEVKPELAIANLEAVAQYQIANNYNCPLSSG